MIAGFIGLMAVIGLGSIAFHTFATVWARLADVIPIGAFVFAYMLLAYRWFLGLDARAAVGIAALVTGATFLMPPLLNGSAFYALALAMLAVTGALLLGRGHGAGKWIAGATGVFIVSLIFRTIDRLDSVCGEGQIGTH